MTRRTRRSIAVLVFTIVTISAPSLATGQETQYLLSWLTDKGDEPLGLYGHDNEGNTVPGQLAVIVSVNPQVPLKPGDQLGDYGTVTPIFIPCGQDPSTQITGLYVITFLRNVRASLQRALDEDRELPSFRTDIPPFDDFNFAPGGPVSDVDYQALKKDIASVSQSDVSSLIAKIESMDLKLQQLADTYADEIEKNHAVENLFQSRFRNCDGELGIWADIIQQDGFKVAREAERTWLQQALEEQGASWTAHNSSWNPNNTTSGYGLEPFRNIWTKWHN